MTRLVSVIIPCYNTARFLGEAIESGLAQTWSDIEIVVVNDGSTDDTSAVARRYGDRVRLVEQANGGLAAARNSGIKAATGEYVGFLDADDRWNPDKVSKQIAALDASPDAVLCHTGRVLFSADGPEWRETLESGRLASGRCWRALCERDRVIVSSVLCRRDVVVEAGGFRSRFPGCEDYDLWLRLAYRHAFCFVPEYLVWYRESTGQMSRNKVMMARSHDGALADFLETIRTDLPPAEWTDLAVLRDEFLLERAMERYWNADFVAARTLLNDCLARPAVARRARRYYWLCRFPILVQLKRLAASRLRHRDEPVSTPPG